MAGGLRSAKNASQASTEMPAGIPGRLRPQPQITDTVVPKRPWSLRASSWTRAFGM
jgi:hypothetical protein